MSANWIRDPRTRLIEVATFQEVWPCPNKDCDGEMLYTGLSFATLPAGHQHRCTECEYNATPADGQRFPRTITRVKT
jgi:hypothetical protein